jgi:hypothetical protein
MRGVGTSTTELGGSHEEKGNVIVVIVLLEFLHDLTSRLRFAIATNCLQLGYVLLTVMLA